MHAYLFVGPDQRELKNQSLKLMEKLKVKQYEFPLAKIEDTRNLKEYTSLKIIEPTAFLIENIENATEEAQNAFLKNLEEPQENLYYFLTTENLAAVLPTIISRCEVIKSANSKTTFEGKMAKPTLAAIEKIKTREDALNLVRNFLFQEHFNLLNKTGNSENTAKNLSLSLKTLNNLKANGNVSLQLSNLVINLV